ncbi:ABC transporter substrate-binding protein [Streptomyces sp. NPDC058391]|uniref:ABC transporter substrate-binding protein n=1 Tax=Streptomyces sp. NPDC058391 TaxID=3346476 RepID=UPI003653B5C4
MGSLRARQLIGFIGSGAIVMSGLTACGGSPSKADKGPGALVAAVSTEPSTLDPQLSNDRSTRIVTDNVFETLLVRDVKAAIQPKLATAYERVDDTTWRLTLRSGVTFQDGSPFDADSVVYSIERIIDPDYETQRTSYIEGIAGALKVDELTVDIKTDGKNPILPAELTSIPMVSEKSASAKGFGQSVVVGTGPYRFSKWDHGQDIQLTRYDGYWGSDPSIERFTVRVIADSQTALSALQAGEVDLVFDLLPEQAQLAPQVKEIKASDFSYAAFNTYKKELSDPRVRVAMNLAVDKELIAKTSYQGHATPNAAQNLGEGMIGFNSAVSAFPYDPEQAKKLLAEAGYPDGFDIQLNVPIGRYSKGEETVELIADELKDIGIRAEVVKHEWNEYRAAGRVKGTKKGAFDIKYGWNSNEWFDAARIEAHITCDGDSSKYCNKDVDKLMAKGLTTFDQTERQSIYAEAWQELHDDPYSIYLLQQNYIYGTSSRLVWTPRPDDTYFVSTMSFTSE